ncbi:MAG: glucose-6-phosphate isomerase [Oscillospiraceae bacterium]|jgi:glucose-6-phosphate isomerase|nr:glucose-6-phosphate isomerase [Oscillospiraceae bacterium]
MAVSLNRRGICDFVSDEELTKIEPQVSLVTKQLEKQLENTGWHNLPRDFDKDEMKEILEAAAEVRTKADVFVVIGVGGSYLGAKAAIEWLRSSFYNEKETPKIYFAGTGCSPSYLNEIVNLCKDKEVYINVISKSGTTLEPAIAFRVFKKLLEQRYGTEEAAKRIFVTTDKAKGLLLKMAKESHYRRFVVPEAVGGRYSVLTPVGLFPMAVAGIDIEKIIDGAKEAFFHLSKENFWENESMLYAAYRNCFNRKGKRIELLIGFDPDFRFFAEWFRQLFAESEGKDGKGVFPVAQIYSTDLHSIGQFVQESGSLMFETVLDVKDIQNDMFLAEEKEDIDSLNFLAGKSLSFINRKIFEGAVQAHIEAGVPNIILEIPRLCEHEYGYLTYFFEKACALSALTLGVNPFDQPGVEAYKSKMFNLLGK